MALDPLGIYLNDHLAGSVAALDMMQNLAEQAQGRPLEQVLRTLHAEVTEEQPLLRDLLARLDAGESALKQVAAWVAEKVGEGKLALAARNDPALGTLQGLESIMVGLQGKLSLYRVLAEVAPHHPRLAGYGFSELVARTIDQQERIERERMAAGRAAFGAPGSGGRER